MKSKLAITITASGWILLGAYLYYDYTVYGPKIIDHLFRPLYPYETFFHTLIALAPFISTTMGYLVNERTKILRKTELSEKRLRHAGEEWRVTFDSIPYGVMLVDNDFNIIRANEYIARITGFPLKEFIGKKCYEVIHRTDKPVEGCPMSMVKESKKQKGVEYYEPRLGIHFMINSVPIFDDKDSVTAYVNSLVDITEIKEKEKKLTDSREAFLNMLKDTDHAYRELKDIHLNLIISFINALDAKSQWTRGHSERVKEKAVLIAREMDLSEKEIEDLAIGALLHDIGKIGTYDILLDKPEKLTEEEFELVRRHPAMGEKILMPIKGFKDILPIIRHHHERYDGKGYPDRLKGEEIPLLARILCIADSFDPMVTDRPYRKAPGIEWAIEEIKRCSGTHFDPKVAEAFLKVLGR